MFRKLSRHAMRLMIGLIVVVVIIICIDHALYDRYQGDKTSINSRLFYSELNKIHIGPDEKIGLANRNDEQDTLEGNEEMIPKGAEEVGKGGEKEDYDKSRVIQKDTANNVYQGEEFHKNDQSYDRIHGDQSNYGREASDGGNLKGNDRGDLIDPGTSNSQRAEFGKDSVNEMARGGSIGDDYSNDRQPGNDTNRVESSMNKSVANQNHMFGAEDSDDSHIGDDSDKGNTALGGSAGRNAGGSMYFADDVNHHEESFDHGAAAIDDPNGGQSLEGNYGGGKVIRDGRVVLGVIPVQGPETDRDQPEAGQEVPGVRRGKPRRKPNGQLDDFSSKWNISEEIRRLAPVVFKFVPPTFHPGYHGFCWININNDLRCMPYFYLLGMPKCGTTDLWDRMVEHPHIIRVLKEPHWWTRGNRNMPRVYISRSISTVKKMVQQPASASEYVLGDGSASYLWDMKRWQDVFDPDDPNKQLFLPHVIRAVTPKAKLIAAFREPVSRLYSEYVYFSTNPSPEAFHDTVVGRIREFNSCTTNHSERKCVYKIALENGDVRPMIGLYSVFARDWLDVFPRDQMLFIRLEDWHLHCFESMPKIFQFLEVDHLPDNKIKQICRIRTKNVNRKKEHVGPILEKTKVLLRQFYQRWNKELADLLGDDRWLWNDVTV